MLLIAYLFSFFFEHGGVACFIGYFDVFSFCSGSDHYRTVLYDTFGNE